MVSNKLFMLIITLIATLSISDFFCPARCTNHNQHEGYIIYCPCMGRFGNQAEQLLGSLLFAKLLNRTLILPPFIHYEINQLPSLVPFDQILQVDPIKQYLNVMTLHEFITNHSEEVWPATERRFYCYGPRQSSNQPKSCDGLKAQPYTTFWSSLNMKYSDSVFYSPLRTSPEYADSWRKAYPKEDYQVLSFVGPPSPFPTHRDSIELQKYLRFSKKIEEKISKFKVEKNIVDIPYMSLHVRHGPDWKKACELLLDKEGFTQLFSSNQCTGYNPADVSLRARLEYETCFPTIDSISNKLNQTLVMLYNKLGKDVQVVHIATDRDGTQLQDQLAKIFTNHRFIRVTKEKSSFLTSTMDLYLMANAEAFIGNCISSFSAFAARIRTEQLGKKETTLYFGQEFGPIGNASISHSEEL